MKVGGFANKIIHVDLAAEKVEYQPIPEEWALKYIGGNGLGGKCVFENGPQVDPLSPENIWSS
jgi:aldehyde:ferredoxin oxidoreductase